MRHLSLVQDDPAPTDFPPGWAEFQTARDRFFAGLAARPGPVLTVVPAGPDEPEERGEAS